jgi:sugar/nucleoside kinase (ribokinase family)
MVSVLVIGYNAFDVICPLSALPPADSKQELPQIVLSGGGPAATAAIALARLGAKVRLVTPLADDVPGRMQSQQLRQAGIDISLCPLCAGHESPKAVILVHPHSGQRTILWSRGSLPPLAPEGASPAWLDDMDLLYLDSHEPAVGTALATAARRRALPVVLDAGTVRPGMAGLVPFCTDVISSSVFAPVLTGLDDSEAALRALARLGPERVAMTFGDSGCFALSEGHLVHVPAFDVPVKDTTGAGDVFHAGYAYARVQGRSWLDCLVFGSAAAALKCRDWGGRLGLPTLAEVEALIATGPRHPQRPRPAAR